MAILNMLKKLTRPKKEKVKKEKPPPPRDIKDLKGCLPRIKNQKIHHLLIIPTC